MILLCYGTRPEWIKIKPLIDEMKAQSVPHKVLFTGQHVDIGGGEYDIKLSIADGSNRLNAIVSSILNYRRDEIFDGVTHVLVQGDTTTGMAIAMSAFHHQIPVIHLEGGLRTWDKENPYPEETNRTIISSIASIHLCPTDSNALNLTSTNVEGCKHVVGNTVLDSIDKTEYTGERKKVLVTLHRRENHAMIDRFFTVIEGLSNDYPDLEFIIPMHPNPNVQKHRGIFQKVNVIDPVGRDELLQLIKESVTVISDSGGIQEECSYLKRNVIVCRQITERPESVGISSFLCAVPENLKDIFDSIVHKDDPTESCPYGNGDSSKRIVAILKELVE